MAEKKRSVLLARKDFLEILQVAFGKAANGEKLATLSRERADIFLETLVSEVITKARNCPFSVRGLGKFYIVKGKTNKEYFRFKMKLGEAKEVKPV